VDSIETLVLTYPATERIARRTHVGVVASGDLEILMEPSSDEQAHVLITTSISGHSLLWNRVLDRFFQHFAGRVYIEINDFGASPGTVMLRLQQAAKATAQ
jgi:malonate decarboxylase delta subunit